MKLKNVAKIQLIVMLLLFTMQLPVFALPTVTNSALVGGSYTGNGTFVRPRGIDFKGGYLYVADSHAQTIQKFDGSGTYISEFGKPNPDIPGYLNDVMDVNVDSGGKIYVTDIDNILEIFNSDFLHYARVGHYGNYLKDGDFESWWSDTRPYNFNTGYSGTTTGIYKRTDWKTSGNYSLGMNPTAGYVEVTREITEVRAGVPYTASIYAVSDYPDKSKLKLYLMFLDVNNNSLAAPYIDGLTGGIGSSAMTKMSVTATAPAGTVKVRLYVRAEATTSGSVAWDDLWFGEANWNNYINYPRAVATDSLGNIYVTDTYNHTIVKFDSNRIYQSSIGTPGTGNGQFQNPFDIVIDGNNMKYVADYSNNRIQIFNADNSFNSKFGTVGTANGQFNNPVAVAVDTTRSRIYVVDRGNHRIQAFDSLGNFVWGMGSGMQWNAGTAAPAPVAGTGNMYFNTPEGIAVDPVNNKLYVADTYNDRIYIINLNNFTTTTFGGSRQPLNGKFLRAAGMSVDSLGNIYATDIFNSRVQVLNSSGSYLRSIGSFGTGIGQLNFPNEVFLDSAQKVYVVDSFNNRVSIFNNDGTVDSNNWNIGTGNYGTGNGDMMNPMYMNIDTLGRYLISEWDSTKFSTTKPGRVQVFNADKTYYTSFYVPQASGIGIDKKSGKIFVCSASDSKIYIFNSDYSLYGTIGQKGYGNDPGFFYAPLDVELDDDLFLYVSDYRNNRICVYDYNGDFITSFGTWGDGTTNFSYPDGIAKIGSNIYVSEWCNDRVHKLTIDPSTTVDNGSFENWGPLGSRPTSWPLGFSNVSFGTGIYKRTDWIRTGSASLGMTAAPSNSYVEATQKLKVNAGQSYTAGVYVVSDVPDKTRIQMYVVWLDANGNSISSTSTNGQVWNIASSSWTQMRITATAPTGAVEAKVYLRHIGGDARTSAWDDFTWQ